jgi:hypothetical protein
MRSTQQPPILAKWLLRHLGCGPNNDAVIGDLDERYERGRSYFWYWRQVLQTILVSFFQDVWTQKLLAGRVLFLGWAIKYAWLWSDAYAYGTGGNRF